MPQSNITAEYIASQWVNAARAAQNGCKRAKAEMLRNPKQASIARATLANESRLAAQQAQGFAAFNARYAEGD